MKALGALQTVAVLVAVLATPGAASSQGTVSDDFRALYEISLRSTRSSATVYEMRGEAAGNVYCTSVVVIRDGSSTRMTSDAGCDGRTRGGMIPTTELPLNAWIWVGRLLFALSTESRVTEVAPRTIATFTARCFDVVDEDVRANLCIEPVSGVILGLDLQRGQAKGTMEAIRVSATSLPPATRGSALPALLELIARGRSSTYQSEIPLPGGGLLTTAQSGTRQLLGLEGYDLATGPSSGERIEINDGPQVVRCTSNPGATVECTTAKALRMVRNAADLLGVIDRQLLGDPEAEATELPARTIAGRSARCFQVRSYLADDVYGVWDRLAREEATVCLDASTGALLSRESDRARPASITVTSFSTTVDPARFTPPRP